MTFYRTSLGLQIALFAFRARLFNILVTWCQRFKKCWWRQTFRGFPSFCVLFNLTAERERKEFESSLCIWLKSEWCFSVNIRQLWWGSVCWNQNWTWLFCFLNEKLLRWFWRWVVICLTVVCRILSVWLITIKRTSRVLWICTRVWSFAIAENRLQNISLI